jgi:hypothetical protein
MLVMLAVITSDHSDQSDRPEGHAYLIRLANASVS